MLKPRLPAKFWSSRRLQKDGDCWLTRKLDLSNLRLLTPFPVLEMCEVPTIGAQQGPVQGPSLESKVFRPSGGKMFTQIRPLHKCLRFRQVGLPALGLPQTSLIS